MCLLKPRDDFYTGHHPEALDVLLVLEVSDTPLPYDRERKIPLYARAAIPEAWQVNLPADTIEVYRRAGSAACPSWKDAMACPRPVDWMTLGEAAGESGLTPDALRRQVLNGRLAARKHGRDWLVSRAALWTYLENRAPSGRLPASQKGRQVRRRTRDPAG